VATRLGVYCRPLNGESNDRPFEPFRVVMFPDTAPGAPSWVSAIPANTPTGTPTWVAFRNTVAFAGTVRAVLPSSDTSSNVLFGNLQRVSARRCQCFGGRRGKMFDAQSIVATGEAAPPGAILRPAFFRSLVLACLVGVPVLLQAYVFTWTIPTP